MKFVCDAPNDRTWFRIETEAEASRESALMNHAVEKHFRRAEETARASYQPPAVAGFEQNIGLAAHIQAEMPLFLTLRDGAGGGLATALLPPDGRSDQAFRIIVVGPDNADPYAAHEDAIAALGRHLNLPLPCETCYPYRS
jgi:hypothetical protein